MEDAWFWLVCCFGGEEEDLGGREGVIYVPASGNVWRLGKVALNLLSIGQCSVFGVALGNLQSIATPESRILQYRWHKVLRAKRIVISLALEDSGFHAWNKRAYTMEYDVCIDCTYLLVLVCDTRPKRIGSNKLLLLSWSKLWECCI